jgi:predicted lipoprotein with Yx(FWY)xxD motif
MTNMKRRWSMFAAALALGAASAAYGGEAAQAFQEVFAQSQKDKKGVTVYVKGQTIPGLVTKVGGDAVEMRSQQYGRIVIRLESIDAVAIP